MGLIDKFKNLFTEEEIYEDEEPIKKEVIHVDIPAPEVEKKQVVEVEKKEEVKVSDHVSNTDTTPKKVENREEKFKFPVYFDDSDFEELKPKSVRLEEEKKREKLKRKQAETKKNYRSEKREPYSASKTLNQEKHEFKPSPIISPVYGILDKNYHKEDISTKRPNSIYTSSKNVTVDDIRNKAFGTLEDDLENTMFGKKSILFNDESEKKEDKKDEFFDDLGFGLDDNLKDKPKETKPEDDFDVDLNALKNENLTLEELNKMTETEHTNTEVSKKSSKKVDDDLFNLIDTMYEKRDEE